MRFARVAGSRHVSKKSWTHRLLVLALLALPLHAGSFSLISYETRPYSGGALPNATDYINLWATLIATNPTPPAGYGATYLAAFNNVSNPVVFGGTNSNVATRIRFNLIVPQEEAGTWNFRFGVDFGWGGAFYVDSTLVDYRNTDMWWNGSYQFVNQMLSGNVNLTPGLHQFDVYGLEGCCSGTMQGQFRSPIATAFQTIVGVPEPSTVQLFSLGLALVAIAAFLRR
jgi:hypothetical protein